ncbi:MAG: Crp/Fnr family transcriptional regulator [Oryzomonas sp.]|uniref:Crp/Fnr family transcriptional regulator n=1 Tax=Oryzomonas sp. TaxID=2855186 RepID=UPI002841CF47|nr:Crp/Fnr family transcriptional regulator [Oryzomonas sp.]MDR3579600.1 Crp/Fnr family transcriptional regulator [Oryzomonas sp.]
MIHGNLDPELANRIVKGIPLFAKFTERELSLLLDRTNVCSYRKDEVIIQADEHNSQMYIVLKGRVKVVDITVDGDERIMAFRRRGDYFGDMGLLDGNTDSATVIAMEPCKVLLVSKSVFDEFFLENNRALVQIIAVLCRRLRDSWIFNDLIGKNDAESKIRATLAHYSKSLGSQDSNGVIINSIFSQQSIADRVHIKRETVSRVLKRMRDQHEIEMVGRNFKLLATFFEKFEQSKFSRSLSSNEH